MRSCRLLLGLVLVLMAPAPPARARDLRAARDPSLDPFLSGVEKTVLPNGLTLLVRPQPGTGVVAINTWVKAGYFHEPDEVAGMAHLFEHMFFKGSKKFPGAEQIAQELSRVGGASNAGTIYDSTNYYFVVPTEGFARGIEIQADAIMNPLFDPERAGQGVRGRHRGVEPQARQPVGGLDRADVRHRVRRSTGSGAGASAPTRCCATSTATTCSPSSRPCTVRRT